MTLDEYVRTRAQYIADHIDVTILLRYTLEREPTNAEVDALLAAFEWQGRKYPPDFFRADTVPALETPTKESPP